MPSPTFGVHTDIEITQEIDEEDKMMFRVVIDDLEVHQVENTDPRVFANVAVYAANPWHSANDPEYSLGFIQDLSIYVKN